MTRRVIFAVSLLVLVLRSGCGAGSDAHRRPKPAAPLARWIDLQNATLNTRYRFIDTSEGVITTNQLQHRETLRARLKFDAPGRYAAECRACSRDRDSPAAGTTPASGWATGKARSGCGALYFAAQPIAGVEGQYGSMYIIKGESTEITTYDDDGYVIGERVSVRRPRQLFFDEMSATVGYFTSDPAEIGVSKRIKYLDDRPNYGHFLVDKKAGTRAGVSVDFTSVGGARTWRAAANVNTRELRAVDSILFENYKRTNRNPAYGFAVTANKALTRKVSAQLGLCQDRSVLRRPQLRPLPHRQARVRRCGTTPSRRGLPHRRSSRGRSATTSRCPNERCRT